MKKRTKPSSLDLDKDSAQVSSALVRGLEILRSFTPNDISLGNQDLIDRTGLPKATVSRLTLTLVNLGYLNYDENLGRYSIGPATISLGYSGLSANAVVYMAMPLMRKLAEKTGVAVAMGLREQREMVYVANARSENPVSLRLNVGSRLPIWRTAMGLSYYAGMEETQRESLLEQMLAAEPEQAEKIRRLTSNALEDFERDGFVASCGDWYSYINAVGVPFRPTDGTQLVAITCGGITDIAPRDVCYSEIGPALKQLTIELQERLVGKLEAPSHTLP
ncbi:IclR family transcriptional regulator [Brucella pseudogrignonensis]|uniref:IclR family transcriptional regulator n=1 Tax=Brucella pseudogrignonensis TaxID=419475 RepID=UPI0007DA97AA|nr:IclR family transcriptional regulator [Brucella pseudogrignonensis]ANG97150.1 IclR family transcriptional regulator [Brucella pseudogrignonensis]KAB2688733.1 IclR family transcriptional regulator [Brucella pseudogrignonensis]MBO1025222.1 IclR family transcriptional regulator [Ochrobactrum sp. SD129]MCD4512740.1 IclR family transcriptional regulator [Brucella pseudogrignonensis]